jgi:hypothetical protein
MSVATNEAAGNATSTRRILTFVICVSAALAVVTATHDLGYLLSWPLSGDESWVVIAKLFPLKDLPTLSSSAPVGWNLMVQGFAVFGLTGGRILVELFAAASVVAAFYAGRLSPVRPAGIPSSLLGVVAAVTIALTPATLVREEVKHYSADAFITMLILYLVLRYLAAPRRGGLIALTAVSSLALLVAFATLFAAIAAFAALLIDAVVRRRGIVPVIVAATISACGLVACYLLFSARGDIPALREFWLPQYPPSVLALPHFVASRLLMIQGLAAFSSVFAIIPLIAIALIVSIRTRHWGFASFLPAMFLVMCVLGLAHRYPLLDGRTSNFFIIAASFYSGIGAVWLVSRIVVWLAHRGTRPRERVGRAAPTIGAAVVGALLLGLSTPSLWAHPLPYYDTSHQVGYVENHLKKNDLVLFNDLASYQVALTWKLDRPTWCADDTAWTGYYMCYPGSRRIRGFESLQQAYGLIDAHLAAFPGSKVWLIRSNVFIPYEQMEKDLFAQYRYAVINLPIQPLGVVTGRLSG